MGEGLREVLSRSYVVVSVERVVQPVAINRLQ